MSLADVSKSMGELATAIARKNAELEKLKAEYTQKLRTVDAYLRKIHPESHGSQTSEQFLHQIKEPITCSNCNHCLYDLHKQSDYMLIPAKSLELSADEKIVADAQGAEAPSLPAQATIPHAKKASGSKSKRTCSYCNKSGHSRARCFTRLSTEPKNQAEST